MPYSCPSAREETRKLIRCAHPPEEPKRCTRRPAVSDSHNLKATIGTLFDMMSDKATADELCATLALTVSAQSKCGVGAGVGAAVGGVGGGVGPGVGRGVGGTGVGACVGGMGVGIAVGAGVSALGSPCLCGAMVDGVGDRVIIT